MIKNSPLWNVAVSQLGALLTHAPMWPTQKHVDEYHQILANFQNACDSDFSAFKIPDSALSATNYRPAMSFFEAAIDGQLYCDASIFRAKAAGLANYAGTIARDLRPPKQAAKQSTPSKDPVPSIYIHEMHGSQFVHSSPNTSIKNTYDPKSTEFANLIKEIKAAIPRLEINKETEAQLVADVTTVELQVAAPTPKHGVITESMHSIRNVLEGCAGSLLASEILQAIYHYLPK